ncbi:helix-turn-helix transcriptional regulator [Rhizobium tropici]|uniref:Helix-turn-helix transcriptional regulator n=1 Tax=Rhizobium tropici TaxID=398 RepID=A0A5B0WES9_RHITR|nr:helix-turn-helix transcriptional regulator [Rhizobium tropici]KAA1184681.1 helix-turn-helix transcriptional regulator [Rhizobium tropici]
MAHDPARGKRVREAISRRQIRKVHALAAELNVSVAAVSRWQNGGHTSLESACALAQLLDVSLDWLLLGRGTMEWHRDSTISQTELQWVLALRSRSTMIQAGFINLLQAIPPEQPYAERNCARIFTFRSTASG